MNRMILSFILTLFLLVSFVPVTKADMAMEGSGNYKGVYSMTFKVLPMEKVRFQMTYEAVGLVVDAPADSPFYNAAFYVLGALHSIKGVFKYSGFIRFTCTNKDNIFATYEGGGKFGASKKVTYTFVGGTGQFVGIEGGAELTGGEGFPHPTKDHRMGLSVGKVHWKIPQKKK